MSVPRVWAHKVEAQRRDKISPYISGVHSVVTLYPALRLTLPEVRERVRKTPEVAPEADPAS